MLSEVISGSLNVNVVQPWFFLFHRKQRWFLQDSMIIFIDKLYYLIISGRF
jgi:hypothetical protein